MESFLVPGMALGQRTGLLKSGNGQAVTERAPSSSTTPTPLPDVGGYLRPSNPAGRFTRFRSMVSCGRPKRHLVSLGTEIGYWYGSGRQDAPPIITPKGWTCPSPELCQLLGLAQAESQSGYLFRPEAAFT